MTALIMDAAERRIRVAGYNGFIFRDLAADVGIKSASIHYHFPTKAIPGAAVLRRHTHHFMQIVNTGPKAGSAKAWREAFVVLFKRTAGCASAACKGRKWGGLPPEIVLEVRRFFESGVNSLVSGFGKPSPSNRARALCVLATLEGAMLLARVLDNSAAFDQATESLDGGL